MDSLVKREKYYLLLLLHSSNKQKKVLLNSIHSSQLRAIVQIVYNIMHGYIALGDIEKRRLSKRKFVIRQFISKGIALKKRKELLLKYHNYILPFIRVIEEEL